MKREELEQFLAAEKDHSEPNELTKLSEQEFEFFSLLAQGLPGSMICKELNVDSGELAKLKARVRKKLGASNDAELVQQAAQQTRDG